MYGNKIETAGVGVYRISLTRVWPAYINSTLWTLFGMSKEDFIQSIQLDNILGGKYTQGIDLGNDLLNGEPIQSKKGVINAIGLSSYSTEIPLEVIYSIIKFDEETSLLFILVLKKNPQGNSFSDILTTFDINSLVFNEMDEVGIEYDRISQSLKLRTVHFCFEACWLINEEELVLFLRRFLHPEDYEEYKNVLTAAFIKPDFGNIPIRLRILHKEYQKVDLWYSSSIDQSGNVYKINAIIERPPSIRQKDKVLSIRSMLPVFIDDRTLLHLEFDMDTNQRRRSENDREIASFPCGEYQSMLAVIRDVFLHEYDRNCISFIKKRYDILKARAEVHDFYCCDVRMLSCIDKNHANRADYRWYHIVQELFFDIRTKKTIGILSIYDIEDTKYNEHKGALLFDTNNTEHMLDINMFFAMYTKHFASVRETKNSHNYSALVLVKIMVGENTDDETVEAFDRAKKVMSAFLHEDEYFCCYAENIFALLLHTHHNPETIQERIYMLDLGLLSDNKDGHSITTNIGYSIINDNDPGGSSLLLERVNISLFWAGLPNNNHIYQYTQDNEERIVEALSMCSTNKNPSLQIISKSTDVRIRTFGSFDIFVDGQAIPFSNEKSKELLAILVDRREGFVTPSQAISYLWEDEPCNQKVLSRLRKIALLLKRQLEKYGVGDLIESVNGRRRLVMRPGVHCEYYELLSGGTSDYQYYGAYMPEYSWAENTNAILEIKYNYFPDDASAGSSR